MFGKKIFHAHAKVEQTEQEPTDYNELIDKPHINNVLLTGNKTSHDLSLLSTDESEQEIEGVKTFNNGLKLKQINGSDVIKLVATTKDGKEYVAVGENGELPLCFKIELDNEQIARVEKDNELQTQIDDIKISNLPDVELTAVSDGEALVYDISKQKWVNADKEFIPNNATANNAIAIGQNAKATAEFACQIGAGINNSTKTLNFLGYRILNEDGRFPNTRLRNAGIPNYGGGQYLQNDTEYTANTDGTLFVQADLGSYNYFTVNGSEMKIGGSVGGHVFNFRIGKGDTYKYKTEKVDVLTLLWIPDKGQ